jgi:hypothetical protein
VIGNHNFGLFAHRFDSIQMQGICDVYQYKFLVQRMIDVQSAYLVSLMSVSEKVEVLVENGTPVQFGQLLFRGKWRVQQNSDR